MVAVAEEEEEEGAQQSRSKYVSMACARTEFSLKPQALMLGEGAAMLQVEQEQAVAAVAEGLSSVFHCFRQLQNLEC
jgi:hypothetical protein